MFCRLAFVFLTCVFSLPAGVVLAQPSQIPPPKVETPPSRDLVAARVNGQPILEIAVYRGLLEVPPSRREQERTEVLKYLIDNMIVDQYVLQIEAQLKIQVTAKEVDEFLAKIKKDAGDGFERRLKDLMITEDEMRTQISAALRWDKFVEKQGTDQELQSYFKLNPSMFNGSQMKARHILVPVTDGKRDDARARVTTIRKRIEDEVAQAIVKLPANATALTREQERTRAIEQSFAKAAAEFSTCPSKEDGGDLGYFPRAGKMVEPFAKAAFDLKSYQMSGPVETEFGFHLILATEIKPGREVKFEEPNVKAQVQGVYGQRLREAVLNQYKRVSKIEIVPRTK